MSFNVFKEQQNAEFAQTVEYEFPVKMKKSEPADEEPAHTHLLLFPPFILMKYFWNQQTN